mmetsp:Transcript_28359/g.40046  ORF Transcript_28359/g.40046 Transcript_28359/m.40046 type:complete len:292 (-) Transcript_28359:2-877(-)
MRSSILLALDFDETITVKDTTQIIVDLAKNSIDDSYLRGDFEKLWAQHADEYYKKLRVLFEEIIETRKHCPDFTIFQANRRISHFERESVAETSFRRFLRGIRREELQEKASTICTHSPALDILAHAEHRGFEVAIISLSWSRDLVAHCISKHLKHNFSICCNDLEFDVNQVSTGKINATIFCGLEKLDHLNRLRDEKRTDQVVYIGDSLGDILPMLSANIGILFHPTPKTLQFCQLFDIQLQPLSGLLEQWRSEDCEFENAIQVRDISNFRGNIFTTDSWDSIQIFVDLL